MKYVKPKIEFIKIENRDNITLSNGGEGPGGQGTWGEMFNITNTLYTSNVNYY